MSQDVSVIIGANADLDFSITDSDGTAVTITSASAIVFTVYDLSDTAQITKALSVGDTEVEITDGSGGVCQVKLVTADTSALSAGNYRYTLVTTISDKVAYSHTGALRLIVAPSSALCLMADVKAYMGDTTTAHDGLYEDLVTRISARIERWCGRTFHDASYREFYNGRGDPYIYVDHPPLISVERVSVGRVDAVRIECDDSTVQRAFVTVTDATNLICGHWVGATASTNTLAFSDYATLTALVAAVNALGTGWTATLGLSDYGGYTSADLIAVTGLNVANGAAYLPMPDAGESDFEADCSSGNNGMILLGASLRGTRAVEVKYTGGYAAIPEDVRQAAVELVAMAHHESQRDPSLTSERLADYAWTAAAPSERGGAQARRMAELLTSYRRWTL